MDLKETYNKIAELWHDQHASDTWWTAATDKFIELVIPNGLVLDAGCGTGVKSKYLIEHGLRVTGIDFSEKMIEVAQREVPQATFAVHNIYALDTLTKMFDGIFMQAVLLHIPKNKVQTIVNAAAKKIKSGGPFYIAVKEVKEGQPTESMITEKDYGFDYSRFFSFFTPEEIKNYLEEAGLLIKYADTRLTGRTNWINVIGQKS